MPKYTYNGRTITSQEPLTEDELEEAFSSVGQPQASQAAPTPQKPQQSYFGELVGNIPSSAWGLAENLYQTVRHPVQTATTLGKTALGGAEMLIPGEQGAEPYAEAFGQFAKERWSPSNLPTTFKEDPVGLLTDALSLVTGVGTVAKVVGTAGKMSKVAQAGKALVNVGTKYDPISMGMRGLERGAESVTKFAAPKVLGVSTGKGAESVSRAQKGTEAFKEGMRGKVNIEDVLQRARNGREAIVADMKADYTTKLKTLGSSSQQVDFKPVRDKIKDIEREFRIQYDQEGNIVRGTIADANKVETTKILQKVKDWDDFTPLGLDELKRTIADYYSESKSNRSIVSQLEKTIKGTIEGAVPEYKDMMSHYRQSLDLLDDIDKSLALGKQSSTEATMKRFISAVNDNNEFKRSMMKVLELRGSGDLVDTLAGINMRGVVPSGLIGRSLFAGAIYQILGPEYMATLATTSPRIVGETLNALAKAAHWYKQNRPYIPASRQAGIQAGRAAPEIDKLQQTTGW